MKALGIAVGTLIAGTVAYGIGAWLRDEYKEAERSAGRKSGRLPPRWTDANRWEKDR